MSGTITGSPVTLSDLSTMVADRIQANNQPFQAVSVSADLTISRVSHNSKLLKFLVPNIVIVPAAFESIGEGFNLVFVNLSGGNVIMAGMTNAAGHVQVLPGATGGILGVAGPTANEVRWFADLSAA